MINPKDTCSVHLIILADFYFCPHLYRPSVANHMWRLSATNQFEFFMNTNWTILASEICLRGNEKLKKFQVNFELITHGP